MIFLFKKEPFMLLFLGHRLHMGKLFILDFSEAQALQGIERIITFKDIPGKNQIGGIIEDEPLFAEQDVHFQGQPIALIVAKDEHTARKALKLINIKIEETEAVTDPRIAQTERTFAYSSKNIQNRRYCRYLVKM